MLSKSSQPSVLLVTTTYTWNVETTVCTISKSSIIDDIGVCTRISLRCGERGTQQRQASMPVIEGGLLKRRVERHLGLRLQPSQRGVLLHVGMNGVAHIVAN